MIAAWALGRSPNRFRAALGGSAAIFLGGILLAGARISATEATLGGRPSVAPSGAGFATPVTEAGLTVTLEPSEVTFGFNTFSVRVVDGTGAPVEGATVTVEGRMPGMEMDEPPVVAAASEPGRYLASDVRLDMFGEWEIIVLVERPGQEPATFPFVVAID